MAKTLELSVSNAELIERLTSGGMIMSELAKVFGISKRSLERRISENPELKAALDKGRIARQLNVRQVLYKMALEGKPKAIMFWLTHIDPLTDSEPESYSVEECETCASNEYSYLTQEQRQTELDKLINWSLG